MSGRQQVLAVSPDCQVWRVPTKTLSTGGSYLHPLLAALSLPPKYLPNQYVPQSVGNVKVSKN
ncbi:uncharacterized protein CCR75_003314 [Bremia lactucae]|uniref:Uncharacterized protein n=1 Tax=Bremia lactucae TaxID=4779 RepID=A0A976NZJ7_BRELC|nr:hypothetical protein CCR75_003314 [Bremia lactucae]